MKPGRHKQIAHGSVRAAVPLKLAQACGNRSREQICSYSICLIPSGNNRVNPSVHVLWTDLLNTGHIMDDSMAITHRMPRSRSVETPKCADAENTDSCSQVHRTTIMPHETHRIPHCCGTLSR